MGSIIWKGKTSTDWNTAANWSTGTVPNALDDLTFGTDDQTTAVTVTTASIGTYRYIIVHGSNTVGTTINVTGAAGIGGDGLIAETLQLYRKSSIVFGSGQITTVSAGAALVVTSALARVSLASDTATNSALTGLSTIDGAFSFYGGVLATTGNLTLSYSGRVLIDTDRDSATGLTGGATVTIGGTVTNSGMLVVGSSVPITSNTTLNVAALDNRADGYYSTGSIYVAGGSSYLAAINVAGAAGFGSAGVLTGNVSLSGNAVIAFASGQITRVAGQLTLDPFARIADVSDATTNSALTGLAQNDGLIRLNGTTLAIAGDLTTNSSFYVYNYTDATTHKDIAANLTIAGTLKNFSFFEISPQSSTRDIVVTANALNNTGILNIYSAATSARASLVVTGAAGFGTTGVLTGSVWLQKNSSIVFGSGQIVDIAQGGSLSLFDASVFLAVSGQTTSNSALTGLATIEGSLGMSGGSKLTTTGGLTNNGDIYLNNGASLTIGGTLDGGGRLTLGDRFTQLTGDTTLKATAFKAIGDLSLDGSGLYQVTVEISGDAQIGSAGVVNSAIRLSGKAMIKAGSGQITEIGGTGSIQLLSSSSHMALASDPGGNGLLSGLSSIKGKLKLEGGKLATNGDLTVAASGMLFIDDLQDSATGAYGGSSVTIGGTLNVLGYVSIGNARLMKDTQVNVAAVTGAGQIDLVGSDTHSAILNIGTAVSNISRQVNLNNAILGYASGQVTDISATGYVSLNGPGARIAIASDLTTNSALTALTTIEGGLYLKGTSLALAGGLALNGGGLSVAFYYQDYVSTSFAGGQVTIGGVLTNHGALGIGAYSTVTVAGIDNSGGRIGLIGTSYYGNIPTNRAQLNIGGVAGFGSTGVLKGEVKLEGDAVIAFGSGQINTIDAGASLILISSKAFIADAPDLTQSSALFGLSTVAGKLYLENGGILTTNQGLVNNGAIQMDSGIPGTGIVAFGGSRLNIGGVLTNNGQLSAGQQFNSSDTLITATGLVNGVGAGIDLMGNNSKKVELNISGSAGFGTDGHLSGGVQLNGNAQIVFGSGLITDIDAGASLIVYAGGRVALASDTTSNSALRGLASVKGMLHLEQAGLDTVGGLVNTGTVVLDYASYNFGGTFNNAGTLSVGSGSGTSLTANFSAKGFVNSGRATFNINAGTSLINGDFRQTASGSLVLYDDYIYPGRANFQVNGAVDIEGGRLELYVGNFSNVGTGLVVANFGAGQLEGMFDTFQANSLFGGGTALLGSYIVVQGLAIGLVYGDQAGSITLKAVAAPLSAANAWTGGSGSWSSAAHWSNGATDFYSDVTISGSGTTVTLDQDATLDTLLLSGNGNLTTNAHTDLVIAAALGISAGSTLTVASKLFERGPAAISGTLVNNGGVIGLRGDILGSGKLTVSNGGRLEFGGNVAATVTMQFDHTSALHNWVTIDHLSGFLGTITGFNESDSLDIAGLAVATAVYGSGNLLTFYDAASGVLGSLTLSGTYTGRTFSVASDGKGGALISLAPVIQLGTPGDDVLDYSASLSPVIVDGLAGNDTITGSAGSDNLIGGAGVDIMAGGLGDDTYAVDTVGDVVSEAAAQGTDSVSSSVSYTLSGNVENLILQAASGNLAGTGNSLRNMISGNAGNNFLDGGIDADTMAGGLGNDTYVVDNLGDVVTEASGEGTDLISSSVSLALGANLENLTLVGSAAIDGTGNGLDNVLSGNAGNNQLAGGAGNDAISGGGGNDTMTGGAGNDSYVVDSSSDVATEAANEGTDLVSSSATFILGANIEGLTLTGSAGIDGTGNGLGNVLTGNAGNNRLDGGAGADTLIGLGGNDTYFIDVAGDVVNEAANEGTDLVNSLISFALSSNFEALTLAGTANLTGTGNDLANGLTGNAGNNVLDGGVGTDTLTGLGGNDTYYVDNTGDSVVEASGGGTDLVITSVNHSLSQFVENLTLAGTANISGFGNDMANVLTGNTGANGLDGGAGADTMVGGNGNDTYFVDDAGDVVTEQSVEGIDQITATFSYTLGDNNIENLTLGGSAAIDGTGNVHNNVITGNSAGNHLYSGGGVDTMAGGQGNDTYFVDFYSDMLIEGVNEGTDLVYTSVNFVLSANIENLTLMGATNLNGTGNDLANAMTGNSGANRLDGGAGADTLSGLGGNDDYTVDSAGDVVIEANGGGVDMVNASVSYSLGNFIEALYLTGTANLTGTGNDLHNTITGNTGDNVLDGGTGADVLNGLGGNDTYYVDNEAEGIIETAEGGMDVVFASASYTLASYVETLTLTGTADLTGTGNALDNLIAGNIGNNVLDGNGFGADTLIGGAGNDSYVIDGSTDVVTELAGEGTDLITSFFSYTLGINIENLTLGGTTVIDGTGNGYDNAVTGNQAGNQLDGGTGADTLTGLRGNDTYYVDNAGDSVVEDIGGGYMDTVLASVSYVLGVDVENLTLTGTANLNGTGNTTANVLTGNSGNNVLDGGGSADTLTGGLGNDTYIVDQPGDVVIEAASAGTDTVQSAVRLTLGDNIENLTLTGALNIAGTGNALDNVIVGNTGSNRLDGGTGADTMAGDLGDDTYVVDDAGDVVSEAKDQGNDTVLAGVSFSIASQYIENLTLTGTASLTATGNGLGNVLTGNSGSNVLDGGTGADTLVGGAGDDTYWVDNSSDLVTELGGEGVDLVTASLSYVLGGNVENLILGGAAAIDGTGNDLNNAITGNAGGNRLDGSAGSDTLTGLGGDDTYVVDAAGDSVVEAVNSGNDTVLASLSYVLGQFVENLKITGASNINGTGNALGNLLTGNTGSNRLDGGTGADTMAGDLGDDTYVVDDAGDVVNEAKDQGNDTVLAGVSFSLASQYIENLTLTGTASLTATGNGLGNVLTGNSGSNVLDGWTGADTLAGGAGNDVYIVDNLGDVVVEGVSAGVDQVQSSVRFTLGDNIERLLLTGVANINGTGNGLVNIITGNDGNNVLDGGAGGDSLTGGLGNDTYIVDDIADIVREGAGQGTDTVKASISYSLGAQYIEALVLTGTSDINGTGNNLANSMAGNAGNNRLDGGSGADTLAGGQGNDTYIVENAGDVVTEGNNQGSDTLLSAVSFALTNAQSIETLTLTGTAHNNASGNTLANILNGNSGNNILNGGSGADTMAGGSGHDIYVVENIGDVVIEGLNAGTDTVQSAVTYVLGDNVENLTLAGNAAINGTGNDLNNTIYGNAGANVLNGMGGVDKLYGRGGDDIYIIDTVGTGASEILAGLDAGGNDTVKASVSFNLGFYIENLILTGTGNIAGGGNDIANTLIGNDGANILKGRLGNDSLTGGFGADQFVFELNSGKDMVTDFSAVQNDRINVHALSNGVVNGAGITLSQVGGDTIVDLGGGNTVTITGALKADVASHMVW